MSACLYPYIIVGHHEEKKILIQAFWCPSVHPCTMSTNFFMPYSHLPLLRETASSR